MAPAGTLMGAALLGFWMAVQNLRRSLKRDPNFVLHTISTSERELFDVATNRPQPIRASALAPAPGSGGSGHPSSLALAPRSTSRSPLQPLEVQFAARFPPHERAVRVAAPRNSLQDVSNGPRAACHPQRDAGEASTCTRCCHRAAREEKTSKSRH